MNDRSTKHRRSIRVRGYDYADRGGYFVTICTQERVSLFGDVVSGEMRLNAMGQFVRAEWFKTADVRANVFLDANEFVVMPNHVHGIIWIMRATPVGATRRVAPEDVSAPSRHHPQGPRTGSLGAIIGQFKSLTTRRINEHRHTPGATVWQRGFYEHVIRRSDALDKIRQYIFENPARWQFDSENPLAVELKQTPMADRYPW
ncbi:MAG: transposase [Acidobacteriota bacterium]|nr:transposase [Acidobacteriota bacterium]